MNTQIDIEKCKILEMVIGSQAYGTSTPQSDTDYMGVFIAPINYYLGLDSIEEIELGVISKLENGKNAPDAVDRKFYEFRKYVKLLMENNPNIVSSLFVPRECVVDENIYGDRLRSVRHMFLHRGLSKKYLGYAFSQRKKMEIKVDNYNELTGAVEWLEEVCSMETSSRLLAEFRGATVCDDIGIKFHQSHATIGDLNISLTDKMSKVLMKVANRVGKVGSREDLYLKHGYDTKFGMHLVRLMLEGKELLTTGNLKYPLKEREMLLDIRNGKWARKDIISYSEELEKEIGDLVATSPLPAKPRYDEINKFLIQTVQSFWRK